MTEQQRSKPSAARILRPPRIIREWVKQIRELGLSGFVKKNGWKVVIAIFLYYLIRDSLLYIVLPVLVARGVLGC